MRGAASSLTDIRSAELRKRILGKSVEIMFRTDRGNETMTLLLARPEDFLHAIGIEPAVTAAR